MRGAARNHDLPLVRAVQKRGRSRLEGCHQTDERRKTNLPNASLDPRDLDGSQSRSLGKVFLRPALRLTSRPNVGSELLDGSIHEPDRPHA